MKVTKGFTRVCLVVVCCCPFFRVGPECVVGWLWKTIGWPGGLSGDMLCTIAYGIVGDVRRKGREA